MLKKNFSFIILPGFVKKNQYFQEEEKTILKLYFQKIISNILIVNTNYLDILKNNDFKINFDLLNFFKEKKNSFSKKFFINNLLEKIKNNKVWFSYFTKIDNFIIMFKKIREFSKSDYLFQNHNKNLFSILASKNLSFKNFKNQNRSKISKELFFNIYHLLKDTKSVKNCLINFFFEFQDILFLKNNFFNPEILPSSVKKQLFLIEKQLDIFFCNLDSEIENVHSSLKFIISCKKNYYYLLV